jgi:hypothetical protein
MMTTPQVPILNFLRTLRWLDGRPLLEKMEPYRQRILSEAVDTWDAANNRPQYNNALTGRGKKNWKTADGLFFILHRAIAWKTDLGNDCLIVSFDTEQAAECLDLLKKLIRKNPELSKRLSIKSSEILRKDGKGFIRIVSGRDVYGQHGKSFLGLLVNELHTQRDYSLLEGLQHDPHRPDAFTWFESYDTLLRRQNIPMFDMVQRGKAGTDARFYFSWFASDFCTDPGFAGKLTGVERANPSLVFVNGYNEYIEQQRQRLPAHLFRRLHENVGGQPQGAAFAAESILNSIAVGVKVRAPVAGIDYAAAVDMSDGSNDDATMAIGHLDQENRAVLDLVMNQQAGAPFDPLKAVKLFAATSKPYNINRVTLDRFAHNTFSSAFASYGITAVLSELTTHQTYEAFGPRLNSGQIVLLDNADLQNQFLGLTWRGAKIDHAANDHDDLAAAVARLASVLSGEDFDFSALAEANKNAPERTVKANRDWLSQDDRTGGGSVVERLEDSGYFSSGGRRFWNV